MPLTLFSTETAILAGTCGLFDGTVHPSRKTHKSRYIPTSHPPRAAVCYTNRMVIGACEITLHLPDCHTLKEKRQVIKSVMARVRNQFEVAIAEVGDNDLWQIATLGVSCVSNNGQHAAEVIEHVRRYIEESRPDLLISNIETEFINW